MAGNNLVVFTDQNFEQEVLNSREAVLVDFWAEWCAPCRAIAPAVEAVAGQFAGRVKVGKLNVDENLSTPQRYNVMGIPALLLFKNGQLVAHLQGLKPKEAIAQLLEQHA